MDVLPLAPGEPLSPELVLVLSPELRARVLAELPAPVWPQPRLRSVEPVPVAEPTGPPLRRRVASRATALGVIFVAATLVTLAMSLVAHAIR